MKTQRDKYNINRKDKTKRTFNGIKFDSELEMRYYMEYVLPRVKSGEIVRYELQHKYILQPAYTNTEGKNIKEIAYVSDFELTMADGICRTIDIKGMLKSIDILKHKILQYRYPKLNFELIGYSKIDGGWVPHRIIQAMRKIRKKIKETSLINE